VRHTAKQLKWAKEFGGAEQTTHNELHAAFQRLADQTKSRKAKAILKECCQAISDDLDVMFDKVYQRVIGEIK
jgi:hypothetical protein